MCSVHIKPMGTCSSTPMVTYSEGRATLWSYFTPIVSYEDGKLSRHWTGYSTTTGRHIAEFLRELGIRDEGKGTKDFYESLPYVEY